jgi:hypothetical protein
MRGREGLCLKLSKEDGRAQDCPPFEIFHRFNVHVVGAGKDDSAVSEVRGGRRKHVLQQCQPIISGSCWPSKKQRIPPRFPWHPTEIPIAMGFSVGYTACVSHGIEDIWRKSNLKVFIGNKWVTIWRYRLYHLFSSIPWRKFRRVKIGAMSNSL